MEGMHGENLKGWEPKCGNSLQKDWERQACIGACKMLHADERDSQSSCGGEKEHRLVDDILNPQQMMTYWKETETFSFKACA